MKYKCFCCGYYTFEDNMILNHDICDVCFWENDGTQINTPSNAGRANRISLNRARKNFKLFNACEEVFIDDVRPPHDDEKEGLDDWID